MFREEVQALQRDTVPDERVASAIDFYQSYSTTVSFFPGFTFHKEASPGILL
jgi:hypothetical protein